MKRIIVVDTNVLLNDPHAPFVYADADIVIPQVVLSELDKIKMTRNDREIRFRGREISRMLFDLSEHGQLVDGVPLDNDACIRVAPHDPEGFPGTLNAKTADDRILGCALQLQGKNPDAQVVLLTNDLNMLLKAQTHGLEVQRHEIQLETGLVSRLKGRLARKRFSLVWLILPVILIGVFAGLWLTQAPSPIPLQSGTSVLDAPSFPIKEAQYINALKKDPQNAQIWNDLGQLYSDWAQQLQANGKFAEAQEKYRSASEAFQHTLSKEPKHAAARTGLGTASYFLGNPAEAVSQFVQAINFDTQYAPAHFNLGFVLYNDFRDSSGAAKHFQAYLDLEPTGERSNYAKEKLGEIQGRNTN